MNKKALAMEAWAVLILALLLGGGMAAITYKYMSGQDDLQKVEICRTSLLFFKQLKHQAGILGIPPKVDCQIIKTDIVEKKKADAMLKIANHLRSCWYKTLGRDNSIGIDFAEFALSPRQIAEEDVDFCLVCSEFTVNQDIDDLELKEFLGKRYIANSNPKITYADYLDTSWGWKETLKGTPISKTPKLVTPENDRFFEYTDLKSSNKEEHKYYVISLNAALTKGLEKYQGGERAKYNHIFIVPKEKVSNIKCGMFHYQIK